MKKYLLNEAYKFYPKSIYGLEENYMQQIEIKELEKHLKFSIDKEYKLWCEILNRFQKERYNAIDYTTFSLNQPSLHFKIVLEENEFFLRTFNLYSSLVIPYYYYSVKTYNHLEKVFTNIEINKDSLDVKLIEMVSEFSVKFKQDMINENYLNLVIPFISFDTIEEGNFTVKNAFFNSNDHFL